MLKDDGNSNKRRVQRKMHMLLRIHVSTWDRRRGRGGGGGGGGGEEKEEVWVGQEEIQVQVQVCEERGYIEERRELKVMSGMTEDAKGCGQDRYIHVINQTSETLDIQYNSACPGQFSFKRTMCSSILSEQCAALGGI